MRLPGLLLSRLDVEQYLVELPPMNGERIEAALKYRLTSLYPGDRASARVDFVRNGAKGWSFLLFAIDETLLAARRAEAKGRALLSPTLVASELAPRGPWAGLFWTAAWASLERFEDGALVESSRIARRGEAAGDLSTLLATLEGKGESKPGARLTLFVAEEAQGEARALEALLSGLAMKESRVLPLAAALSRVRKARVALFPPRPRARRARAFALAGAACLDLLLAGLLAARSLGGLEAELSRVKEDYLRLQRRNGEALRLVEELAAKEKRYSELAADLVPDMYAVIASVAANSGPGCRILSLVVEGGEFRMEAEGSDALASLAALELSSAFESVRLHESLPGEGGRERFTLSGRAASGAGGLRR